MTEALKRKKICYKCIGDEYLKDKIKKDGNKSKCSYCEWVAKSYSIDSISEIIEKAFEDHYVRTADQPNSLQISMLSDNEMEYDWEREGDPIVYAIRNSCDMPEESARDIQKILGKKHYNYEYAKMGCETDFCLESHYEEKGCDDSRWQKDWQDFERSIQTESRFFSRSAVRLLESIFDGIDKLKTRYGQSLIVSVGPNTSLTELYRARVFQSDGTLKNALIRPDIEIGTPPSSHARAGRMNAHGISVFYGANNPNIALAEVRPPVGSKVAVARFELIRPLQLLDLTALNEVIEKGSIFDPNFANRLARAMFLRKLSQRITMPVMPDDEPFKYLTTQAIADFLATESQIPVDGIIYPSVQGDGAGLNIVLFHKAARVQKINLPKGIDCTVRFGEMYEEGFEFDFTVYEKVPPKKNLENNHMKSENEFSIFGFLDDINENYDKDTRKNTLKVDLENVVVHIIQSVEFRTDDYRVRRHRFEKGEEQF